MSCCCSNSSFLRQQTHNNIKTTHTNKEKVRPGCNTISSGISETWKSRIVGDDDGGTDSNTDGDTEGDIDGDIDGDFEGDTDGDTEGDNEGCTVWDTEGDSEGLPVDSRVENSSFNIFVGDTDGDTDSEGPPVGLRAENSSFDMIIGDDEGEDEGNLGVSLDIVVVGDDVNCFKTWKSLGNGEDEVADSDGEYLGNVSEIVNSSGGSIDDCNPVEVKKTRNIGSSETMRDLDIVILWEN